MLKKMTYQNILIILIYKKKYFYIKVNLTIAHNNQNTFFYLY